MTKELKHCQWRRRQKYPHRWFAFNFAPRRPPDENITSSAVRGGLRFLQSLGWKSALLPFRLLSLVPHLTWRVEYFPGEWKQIRALLSPTSFNSRGQLFFFAPFPPPLARWWVTICWLTLMENEPIQLWLSPMDGCTDNRMSASDGFQLNITAGKKSSCCKSFFFFTYIFFFLMIASCC